MLAELANRKHELKTWPEFFRAVIEGRKSAELRRDDRDFREGDLLWLREWDNDEQQYTGREASAVITHIVRGTEHLADGFALLSFGLVTVWHSDKRLAELEAEVARLREEREERERLFAGIDALHDAYQDLGRRYGEVEAARDAALARAEAAERELQRIDAVMARRPALDKPTRWENVEHAINTAKRADDALRALADRGTLQALKDANDRAEQAEAALAAEREAHEATKRLYQLAVWMTSTSRRITTP